MNVILKKVKEPQKDGGMPIELTKETYVERKAKIVQAMKQKQLDKLVIYGDVEHGSNFEYLIGYFTRFEEALLVIDKSGEMTLVLGNENLNKASKARLECKVVHVSLFSLPNQPNRKDLTFKDCLKEAGLKEEDRIGVVGWKLFTCSIEDNQRMFDVPCFIMDALQSIVKKSEQLVNATSIFIGENGARTTNNANEIAHYEYGASLASDCIMDATNLLEEGVSEFALGDALVRNGQHTSIVTIASSGPRFVNANMFPSNRTVHLQDPVSLTVGYRGGSSSRAGYAVKETKDLPTGCEDYLQRLVFPYFNAYATWLETIRIGKKGSEMFDLVEKVLPRAQYHWSLCPGHLTGEEEWMSSPIYENSEEIIKSGMIFQIDIIPSIVGLAGTCAESTVVLADETLKKELQKQYPAMWERMQKRIAYMKEELGIVLSEDVLPMCSSVAYMRPYLLNKECACAIERGQSFVE